MAKHPLRLATETGASDKELVGLLAPDAVIYSSILTQPVRGAESVAKILSAEARIAGPIDYEHELNDGKQTFLIWRGTTNGFTLGAATIVTDNPDRLISEVRVIMRPWPVVTVFRDAMHEELSAVVPDKAWELQARPSDNRSTATVQRDLPRRSQVRAQRRVAQSDSCQVAHWTRRGEGRGGVRPPGSEPVLVHNDHRDDRAGARTLRLRRRRLPDGGSVAAQVERGRRSD